MKIGVLGAGQLGRMLALAGYPLGHSFRFFDTTDDAVAGQVGELQVGDYGNVSHLQRFAEGLDVITYEWENVPLEAVRTLEQWVKVYPPSAALEQGQDRFNEKSFFKTLGIPTPDFFAINSLADLEGAIAQTGLPAVLKTRRMGYDGKGQMVLRTPQDLPEAWQSMGSVPLILEAFVPFEREVSSLAARGTDGSKSFYPLVQNHHEGGILRTSIAPAPEQEQLMVQAQAHVGAILDALNYVGVLAVEWFVVGEQLVANEMAPRVHNSGHFSIEGAVCSQFENHIRAVSGLPVGSGALRGTSTMLNLIGEEPTIPQWLADGWHVHWYGKSVKPGRKVGHLTKLVQ